MSLPVESPSWSEYFMGVAMLSSMRSKDPSRKVGACIVNSDNRIVGIGYNGFPVGCSGLPWTSRSAEQEVGFLGTKHAYVCHAELNAVVNALSIAALKGATLYVTCFPCNECAKLIVQVGISRIFYQDDDKHDSDSSCASRVMFDLAKIDYRPMDSTIEVTMCTTKMVPS